MSIDYKSLLNKARNHFEATTKLTTESVKLKVINEDWFEVHQDLYSLSDEIIATMCSNGNGTNTMMIREDKVTSEVGLLVTMLHELTHQFVQPHNNEFYDILKQTGVHIGRPTGYEDYRYESPTPTIRRLLST